MRAERNGQGIDHISAPMEPGELNDELAGGVTIVVPVHADVRPGDDGFDVAVNAAVLGPGAWSLQWDEEPERVGWVDKDTVLWRIALYAKE